MALSDAKKVQTMINVAASQMTMIRAATNRLETIRDLFIAASANVAGTPLEGNLGTLNTALNDLLTETDSVIWTVLIANEVPSHRGRALD